MRPGNRLILVSNRLPVKVVRKNGRPVVEPSTGGLATGLVAVHRRGSSIWIGWPGIPLEEISWSDRRRIEEVLASKNLYPVFLTRQDIEDYYYGFCNKIIWPLFHYFSEKVRYEPGYWDAYVRVNKAFAEAVLQIYKPGDVIWIHDYHLMLLPELLRRELGDDVPIGYFLHIPFPSSEVFRLLPWRREILQGILGADLVGFHTYDYVRHFLSSVRRLLGFDHVLGRIYVSGRVVKVDAFPMGINYEELIKLLNTPEVEERYRALRETFKGLRVIFSIDRLDYTKGIVQRLKAYELFLEQYPEYRGKVVFVLVVSPSRMGVEEYVELKKQIDELVGKINGKYATPGWSPVLYMYRYIPVEELLALYRVAEVALITPLRDGMNLVSKEFVASKVDGDGVLILSEGAGASLELVEALVVNPNNREEVARAIKMALEMPRDERAKRMWFMQLRVKRYDVFRWADDFLESLNEVKEEQSRLKAKVLTVDVEERLVSDYVRSRSRLILLDYDGTLTPLVERPDLARPDGEVVEILRRLAETPGNEVVIVSGRDRRTLDEWFGDLDINLVAEHGAWIKERGGSWRVAVPLKSDWKREIRRILELYVDRTPGSFIEEKEFSIAWHYRRAGVELGETRAKELKEFLTNLVATYNLEVIEGNRVIEIRSAGISKGRAVLNWLKKRKWDFILAIGDDRTDEEMFATLPEYAYTIRVGIVPSRAKYNVPSPYDVRRLLKALVKASE